MDTDFNESNHDFHCQCCDGIFDVSELFTDEDGNIVCPECQCAEIEEL